jgi:hypothetical protein
MAVPLQCQIVAQFLLLVDEYRRKEPVDTSVIPKLVVSFGMSGTTDAMPAAICCKYCLQSLLIALCCVRLVQFDLEPMAKNPIVCGSIGRTWSNHSLSILASFTCINPMSFLQHSQWQSIWSVYVSGIRLQQLSLSLSLCLSLSLSLCLSLFASVSTRY